jgi:cell division protein WhiA
MIFSTEVKQELASVKTEKSCCVISELNALTQFCGTMTLLGNNRMNLFYRTKNATVAKRIFVLLKRKYAITAAPRLEKYTRFGGQRFYILQLNQEDSHKLLLALHILKTDKGALTFRGVPRRTLIKKCCQRAFLRGAFLGAGSMTTHGKGYHLEFSTPLPERAETIRKILFKCDIAGKCIQRRGNAVLYIKDSEKIAIVLALMGASQALLQMENIRAQRSLRESVTRMTNCDQQNLNRQLTAAQRQAEAIKSISLQKGINHLPKSLQEAARLRLSNPDVSLEQLGRLLSPPVGKSGINHKMRQIITIAKNLTDRTVMGND